MNFYYACTVLNRPPSETPARAPHERLPGASELGLDTLTASFREVASIRPSVQPSFASGRRGRRKQKRRLFQISQAVIPAFGTHSDRCQELPFREHDIPAVSKPDKSNSLEITDKVYMGLSPEQYLIGQEELLSVLRDWDAKDPVVEDQSFDRWLERVQNQGWSRRDVYDLIRAILEAPPSQISEVTINLLAEAETSITGYCDVNCIYRFPNDPSGKNEFIAHVRGNRWR